MNRRGFLRNIALGIGGIALEQAVPLGRVWSFPRTITLSTSERIDRILIEHWKPWEIEGDGTLSLFGQSIFPEYDRDGKPTTAALQYRVQGGCEGGIVQQFRTTHGRPLAELPTYPSGRTRIRSIDRHNHIITLDTIPA